MDSYLDHSAFLPYLNNEKYHSNAYLNKKRFEDLNHLLMVKFMYDPVIYPMESAFFGEINDDGLEVHMEKTQIYLDNTFGLRTLHETGRIDR
jgi:palmitoyl-protein thioesterase